MKVTSRTKEDLEKEAVERANSFLLQPGDYSFEVFEATEKTSAKGNEMIALKLGIYDSEGANHIVYDYLLDAMAFKMRHFCEATELIEQYEAGTLTADDCMGKTGYCSIKIDPANGNYAAKNSVKDYVVKSAGDTVSNDGDDRPIKKSKPAKRPVDPLPDDEIPFN